MSPQKCYACKGGYDFIETKDPKLGGFEIEFKGEIDCVPKGVVGDYYYKGKAHRDSWFIYRRCMEGCKKCTDGTSCSECIKTADGANRDFYYIENTENKKCAETCTPKERRYLQEKGGEKKCFECPEGEFVAEDPPTTCTKCDQKDQFVDPKTNLCRMCGTGCASCEESDTCDECQGGLHIDAKTSPQGCRECNSEGEYIDENTNSCQKCNVSCKTCKDALKCESCKDTLKFLLNDTGKCVNCNEDGYFKSGSFCMRCPSTCARCSSETECLSCIDSGSALSVDKSSCTKDCGEGFEIVKGDPNKCAKQEKKIEKKSEDEPKKEPEEVLDKEPEKEPAKGVAKNIENKKEKKKLFYDYFLTQVQDPKREKTFEIEVKIQHHSETLVSVKKEIQNSILKSQTTNLFKIEKIDQNSLSSLPFTITQSTSEENFTIQFDFPDPNPTISSKNHILVRVDLKS